MLEGNTKGAILVVTYERWHTTTYIGVSSKLQDNMGWTVVKIDEQGQEEGKLSKELSIDHFDTIDINRFRLIKYLDPFGDTTFNSLQFDDLLSDFKELEKNGQLKTELLTDIEGLISECKSEVHAYIKFYGD